MVDGIVINNSVYIKIAEDVQCFADVKIGGSLDLKGNTVKSLGNLMNIGILMIKGEWYNIYELPEGLEVEGELDLSYTKISELPKGLTVSGDLDIRGTRITKLPENLTVGRDIYLRGSKITKIPKDTKVGGEVVGLQIS